MKILVVTAVFYPENFIINDLVIEWQKQGVKVDVLTQWPSYPQGKVFDGYKNSSYSIEQWGESTIYRFKFVEGYRDSIVRKLINYWTFVRVGKKIAKKIGGNYDHIFVNQSGPLTIALPAIAIKKKFGTPLTIWTFDIWPNAIYIQKLPFMSVIDIFLTKLIKNVYGNSDNILVSSKNFDSIIKHYVPDKKINYIPNWLIKEDFIKSKLRLNKDMFNFTFTGNVSMGQNLKNVIKGFGRANLNNARLNIIGDGTVLKELKILVEKKNIENVIFYGRYPSNQINDILTQSDVLVLPLIADEGVAKTEPFKIQSYLTAGKPILGVIIGSGKEIIEEEKLGICASPNDIADIADKFKEIIDFESKNKDRVTESAHRLLQTRFNKEKIIDKINYILNH